MKVEKVTKEILAIHNEYEQALFNYQEYGGDLPKELEYFKREVKVVQQYADKVNREVAVDFELRHVYKGASKSAKKLAYIQFDEWKSKQEQP